MDPRALDRLAAAVASTPSRRRAAKVLAGGMVAAVAGALLGRGETRADCPRRRSCPGRCCPRGSRCRHGGCFTQGTCPSTFGCVSSPPCAQGPTTGDCFCHVTVGGAVVCARNEGWCSAPIPCDSNADCQSGRVCVDVSGCDCAAPRTCAEPCPNPA